MTIVHVDGASGYAAGELVRVLARHPIFEIGVLASRSSAGGPVADVFPSLAPLDLKFGERRDLDAAVRPGDAVAFAGETVDALTRVDGFLERGARVIDLSAAFRMRDISMYPAWYGFEHSLPELVCEAAYGLPEIHRISIAAARLVANPGCYPTASLLALAPLAQAHGAMIESIVIDAKSGISGAGRSLKASSLYSEVEGSVRPYAPGRHRHIPELGEQLQALGCRAPLVFVPHVVPLSRGLLASCYVRFSQSAPSTADLIALFDAAYADRPLVEVLAAGSLPETRAVARTARASVGVALVGSDVVAVACAIDNLGKGAAAQAIQNLNIMFGLAEDLGLDALAAVA
jgi:N-acetyl-gamma-glutamyl-phosphate reductase